MSLGAQWLSGGVFNARPRGCEFDPHRQIDDWDVKNQIKQNNKCVFGKQ